MTFRDFVKDFFHSNKNVVLFIFKLLFMLCSHSSSGKQKGKKSGGKEKAKNIKSNTGAEELPEVCTVQDGFIFLSLIKR